MVEVRESLTRFWGFPYLPARENWPTVTIVDSH